MFVYFFLFKSFLGLFSLALLFVLIILEYPKKMAIIPYKYDARQK